ncbi:MAG: YciI family protein, partial [Planctomycetota bacterium]
MKTLMPAILTMVCGGAMALAPSPGPPGMTCQEVIVVRYHPGPEWKLFDQQVAGHLAFLRQQMEAGKLLYAGPFLDEGGGYSIYALTDLAEMDALVRLDPL